MGKIYKGQTDLTITITTEKDITGASSTKIGYKNPKNEFGEFTAVSKDGPNGVIEFNVTNEINLGVAGTWYVWAIVTDAQGLVSIGEASTIEIHEQGN